MPMVVYTEEEVIDKCNEAEAMGASRAAADRDRAMANAARLRASAKEACDLLAEREYGSPARSAGHNARLVLEAALQLSE